MCCCRQTTTITFHLSGRTSHYNLPLALVVAAISLKNELSAKDSHQRVRSIVSRAVGRDRGVKVEHAQAIGTWDAYKTSLARLPLLFSPSSPSLRQLVVRTTFSNTVSIAQGWSACRRFHSSSLLFGWIYQRPHWLLPHWGVELGHGLGTGLVKYPMRARARALLSPSSPKVS